MATTTNYGWTTPDDTALVKDGAAAIRTLGSSVDTTTKALNPSTTLGDIEYRSSTANTNTRLGIGSSGQFLSVAAGVPSWVTLNAGGMTLLSTTTLSGASTTISSIDGTYVNLFVTATGIATSADAIIRIAPNNVDNLSYLNRATSLSGTLDASTVTYVLLTGGSSAIASGVQSSYAINFFNYASTKNIPFTVNGSFTNASDGMRSYFAQGAFQTTSALSSLVFSPSTGTFSGGTVKVYGVK
jgi:hypothetical protein